MWFPSQAFCFLWWRWLENGTRWFMECNHSQTNRSPLYKYDGTKVKLHVSGNGYFTETLTAMWKAEAQQIFVYSWITMPRRQRLVLILENDTRGVYCGHVAPLLAGAMPLPFLPRSCYACHCTLYIGLHTGNPHEHSLPIQAVQRKKSHTFRRPAKWLR
jgi:hypothetical protein